MPRRLSRQAELCQIEVFAHVGSTGFCNRVFSAASHLEDARRDLRISASKLIANLRTARSGLKLAGEAATEVSPKAKKRAWKCVASKHRQVSELSWAVSVSQIFARLSARLAILAGNQNQCVKAADAAPATRFPGMFCACCESQTQDIGPSADILCLGARSGVRRTSSRWSPMRSCRRQLRRRRLA